MDNKEIKESSKAVWGATPAGTPFGQGYEKGTKEFFLSVVEKRFSYECNWLDEIVHFEQYRGKKVLEIGCGAGYDAYQFCKIGADYTGIDITPQNRVIAQQHLSSVNLSGHIFEMDVENITFDQEFDFVYSFGVLHHVPDIKRALANIYHALKPQGTFQIIVYNRNSIFYRLQVIFADWILEGKFLKMTLQQRMSQIEYTTSNAQPLVNVYSKRELHTLLKSSGFEIKQTHIRKLVREDLPDIPVIRRSYKYIPDTWLSYLGNYYGWYISVLCVKN